LENGIIAKERNNEIYKNIYKRKNGERERLEMGD